LFGAYKEHLRPLYAREYEKFGIEESRGLIDLAGLKNYKASVFLLAISSITSEAQQALLKLLEEPQEGTTFVLIVPHGVLLPTIKSRMLEYPDKIAAEPHLTGQARKFLQVSGKERSDFITKLLKDDEGVKERARDFVNALEAEVYKKSQARSDLALRQGLEDIAKVRDYLRDRSPSLKMLLEHLAVALPML